MSHSNYKSYTSANKNGRVFNLQVLKEAINKLNHTKPQPKYMHIHPFQWNVIASMATPNERYRISIPQYKRYEKRALRREQKHFKVHSRKRVLIFSDKHELPYIEIRPATDLQGSIFDFYYRII